MSVALPRPGRGEPERRGREDVARISWRELFGTALFGLRARRLRASLSALGIAIGIGAMVAVVGISASSQADLLATIDRLGTNLLTVAPGTGFFGQSETLPSTAIPMIGHMQWVQKASGVYAVSGATVLRTNYVPSEQTGGIGVDAADTQLPSTLGADIASGHWLTPATANYPTVVLGAGAAQTLQITQATGHVQLFIGGTWFTVVGVMKSFVLSPDLDQNVFIGLPVAERMFRTQNSPTTVYLRANVDHVGAVSNLLAPTADPQTPDGVQVSRPSDSLEARAAAKTQFTTLLLALGAVALLVGGIGIANIMVISVLERRGEIGLRRALGATRRHISSQFLMESALLASLGGVAGLVFGTIATLVYSIAQNQPMVVPLYALIAGPASGFAIGAIAGLYPARKAARLSPTEALRST